jgi:hypothetical protein
MSMPPGLIGPWEWIQPRTLADILSRLRVARDCRVPERERENMCSVAHDTIAKLETERNLWKIMAEEQYAERAYPTRLELGEGALTAMFRRRLGRESLV